MITYNDILKNNNLITMKNITKSQFLKLTIYLFTIIIFPLNSNAQWQILKSSFGNEVTSMVNDVNGNLFVASGKIVWKWDGKDWSRLGGANYSFNENVNEIVKDKDGNIYAAGLFTNPQGQHYIAKFDGKTWFEFGILDGIKMPNSGILRLVFDKNDNLYASGNLWKGNGPYVSKFTKDGQMVILGDTNNSPFNNPPQSLVVDLNGNVYALSYPKNAQFAVLTVFQFDGKNWIQLPDLGSLYSTTSSAGLASDIFGNIYFGGNRFDEVSNKHKSWLFKWNNKSWVKHNDREYNGFINDPINKIIIDGSRNIYVGRNTELIPIISVLKDSVWEDFSWLNNAGITGMTYDNAGTLYVAGGYSNFRYIVAKYQIKPTISSFSPTLVSIGGTVTIKGKNFNGTNSVTFGGVVASSFTVINDTTINAIVGNGSTGSVSVTTPGGKDSLAGFIFTPTQTGLLELTSKNLQVYPNPAQDNITIQSEMNVIGQSYNIYDCIGKLVLNGAIENQTTPISLQALNNGIYTLVIGTNSRKVIKLVKSSSN
jgi:hypothetical protein